ncbi:MAG: hypothetical protein IJ041_06105 [Clostridia bacterium]|nr:hypothetical protein [Clostridia bacterium]
MNLMKKALIFLLLMLLLSLPATGFATATENAAEVMMTENRLFAGTDIPAFALTSENLTDGAWDPIIGKHSGENLSPQLSWEPVPGASCYVIYMVDTKVMDYMHWMSNNVTETTLPQGWADIGEYTGPTPPAYEIHPYDVYVLALRQPVEDLKSSFGVANVFFAKNVMYLDTPAEGITDNLLGYGYLSGTYGPNE